LSVSSASLTRSSLGITILRKNKWKLCHPLINQIICSKFSSSSSLNNLLGIESIMFFLPRKI
jgi:hypothetical protein